MQEPNNSDYLDRLYDEEFTPIVEALNDIRRARGEYRVLPPSWGTLPLQGEVPDARYSSAYGMAAAMQKPGREATAKALLAEVARERVRNPELFKGTAVDLDQFLAPRLTREKQKRAAAGYDLARSDGSMTSGAVGFAGGTSMALQDSDNLKWMLIGGWGRTFGMRILTEGMIGAGQEVINLPKVVENRAKLGETMSTGEKAENVLYGAVGAAAFRGALETLPHAARGVAGSVNIARSQFERAVAANWDRLPEGLRSRWQSRASATDIVGEQRLLADMAEAVIGHDRLSEAEGAAIKALRRDADVAQINPFEPTGLGTLTHSDRLNAALAQLSGMPEHSAPAGLRSSASPVAVRSGEPLTATGREVKGFDMNRYMRQTRSAESSGSDVIKAATSSAYGRYQFLKETWVSFYKATYGETGESRDVILRKRADGNVQDRVMRTFTVALAQQLRQARVPVNDATVYLAHFLGPADAVKVLKAAADEPVAHLVRSQSIAANGAVFNRIGSASELIAWAERKMGGDGASIPSAGRAGAGEGEALAALEAEAVSIAADRSRIAEGRSALAMQAMEDGEVLPPPQLRRDLFGSDMEWRLAQAVHDAEALGHGEAAFTRQDAWIEARDRLTADKGGEVRGALYHDDVGAIDVKWGDAKGGLAHIVAGHPEVLEDLPAILEAMEITQRSDNRIRMESPDHKAVVRLDFDGEAQQWLLTAFEVTKGKAPPAAEDGGAASGARDRSPSAGAAGDIGAKVPESKLPLDLRSRMTPYPPRSSGLPDSGFFVFKDGEGRTVSWHPQDGVANGASPKRTGVSADDVREWMGLPRGGAASDPRIGDLAGDVASAEALARAGDYSDPIGPKLAEQADRLWHDMRTRAEDDGIVYRLSEGDTRTAKQLVEEFDAEDAALKALRGCL